MVENSLPKPKGLFLLERNHLLSFDPQPFPLCLMKRRVVFLLRTPLEGKRPSFSRVPAMIKGDKLVLLDAREESRVVFLIFQENLFSLVFSNWELFPAELSPEVQKSSALAKRELSLEDRFLVLWLLLLLFSRIRNLGKHLSFFALLLSS